MPIGSLIRIAAQSRMKGMLRSLAVTARSFLLPHWSRWHQLWGPPAPLVKSQWTCVRSSMFLAKVLQDQGIKAVLQSGQAPSASSGITAEECGLLTVDGWMGHAWVEANGFIIDITADQFGHAPVVVKSAGDPAYRPARDERYRIAPTKTNAAAVNEIWPLWRKHIERRHQPLDNTSLRLGCHDDGLILFSIGRAGETPEACPQRS